MQAIRGGKSKTRPWSNGACEGTRLPVVLIHLVLALAGFALFAPLVISNDFYYPDIFLKSILFRIAVQAMVLLYVALAVFSPSHRARLNRLGNALLAYFGLMLISSLPGVSIAAWNSWWGDFCRMGGMITQLHLLAYFFVLTQTLKRERDWIVLFTAALFAGLLMGYSGFVQLLDLDFIYRFTTESRIRAAAGNSLHFACHMMLNLLLVFWLLGRGDKRTIYPLVAKTWMAFVLLMDLFLLVWSIATSIWSTEFGSKLLPIVVFALILHAASLYWFFHRDSTRVGSIFLSILGAYFFYWMYHSQTRGTMVGLMGSLLLLLVFYVASGASKIVKRTSLALGLVVFLSLVIVFLNRQSPWIQNQTSLRRFTMISSDKSLAFRFLAWKAGMAAILDRPFFGWGLENYKYAFSLHFPPQIFYEHLDPQVWYDRAHNSILDIGTMSGFLGLTGFLVFYALVFAFLLRCWFRSRDPGFLLIATFLLAYLLQNLSSFDSVNTDGIVYLMLAYVTCLSARDEAWFEGSSAPGPKYVPIAWKGWLLIMAVAPLIPSSFWYAVKEPYESNRLLSSAIAQERAWDPETRSPRFTYRDETIDLFKRANDYQTTGRFEVREELANYASELAQTDHIPLEGKIKAARQTIDLLEQSIRQEPSNARHYMYLASLVNKSFDALREQDASIVQSLAERNLQLLQQAERMSPTRPQIYIERGQTLAFLGRFEEAIAAIQKAVELYPFQKEPHIDLITLYISVGRYEDAAKEWRSLKTLSITPTPEDYDRVLRFYNSKRQFQAMAGLYLEQLEKTPNDARLLARLAATYRELGAMDLAAKAAVRAAELSPEFSTTLQDFLNSLKKLK